MKQKICFVIGNYNNGGGTERVTSQVANGLVDRGYNVAILSIGKGLNPHFDTRECIELYEADSLKSFPFNKKLKSNIIINIFNKIFFRVWCIIRVVVITHGLKQKLKKIRADVVIAVDIECYRYIDYGRKKLGYKAIGWEHFCLDSRNSPGVNYSRFLAAKHAARIVVLGDKDKEAYIKKYPKANNIQRIYNPIAYDISRNVDVVNNKVVISAGRYTYQKGFDMLIDSWARISDKVLDWELRIFGDGEDREKLQEKIYHYNLKNIRLCGYSKNLDDEFNKASVFALSSRYEGWGLVLLEAQAKGLPCISYDCKQGPSQIIDNGVNGFLVSPNNVDEFADKLLMLIQDEKLRVSFSKKSQKDLYRFNTDNVLDQWDDLLKSI